MPEILVLGGGVCGLAAATMLARDGHDVTVLERDAGSAPGSPEEAWEGWERPGVAQFRQAHYLQPRAWHVLDAGLPEIRGALASADAAEIDTLSLMPPAIADRGPRPGDERFRTLTARRSTIEQAFAQAADAQQRLEVRRGVPVAGLVTQTRDGLPHVTGVRTEAGDELAADLVVDAMGRRSPLPKWLRAAGATPIYEEAEDCGFIYYTRFFRSSDGTHPQPKAGFLTPIGSFSLLTLPADRGTWSVTVYVSSHDQPLKGLRHPDVWTELVRACPLHAQWLDGEPISGILPMGGVIDQYRRLIVDGQPVATGVVPVGDASSCTNPSVGRGISFGLIYAELLRDAVRAHLDGSPRAFSEAFDAMTEREVTPWYRATVAGDRARLAQIDALRAGLEPPRPSDPDEVLRASFLIAMAKDADVFRAFTEVVACLALPGEVLARPGMADRVLALAEGSEPQPPPGPSREQVLRLLASG